MYERWKSHASQCTDAIVDAMGESGVIDLEQAAEAVVLMLAAQGIPVPIYEHSEEALRKLRRSKLKAWWKAQRDVVDGVQYRPYLILKASRSPDGNAKLVHVRKADPQAWVVAVKENAADGVRHVRRVKSDAVACESVTGIRVELPMLYTGVQPIMAKIEHAEEVE